MKPWDYITAARVPETLEPQQFGLWTIERRKAGESILFENGHRDAALNFGAVGFPSYTLLRCVTMASLHRPLGEVVMEDSARELRKHLPIWMTAHGRVLKTGLGLGCVVRGLLAKPAVEHIDVVEIDEDIIRVIGAEFAGNPRVTIHHADAVTWDYGDRRWDYIWHDLHSFGEGELQAMHAMCFGHYCEACPIERQGAWAWPRWMRKIVKMRTLGSPR